MEFLGFTISGAFRLSLPLGCIIGYVVLFHLLNMVKTPVPFEFLNNDIYDIKDIQFVQVKATKTN